MTIRMCMSIDHPYKVPVIGEAFILSYSLKKFLLNNDVCSRYSYYYTYYFTKCITGSGVPVGGLPPEVFFV